MSAAERREVIAFADDTYVEAFVGYRQWRVAAAGGRVGLSPLSARFGNSRVRPWTDGPQEAICYCLFHDREPRCGWHAWVAQPKVMLLRPGAVWGETYLWGDVNIFEKGYRAQYALVAALYVFDAMDERTRLMVELAALQYSVPTVTPQMVETSWPGSSRLSA